MRLSHARRAISARFDDPNLVSCAGLVPVMALADRCGLPALLAEHVKIIAKGGANAAAKVLALVAGMICGADSITDLDLLRHGAMARLFNGVRAPSTLGTFLRLFTFGHVRQLDAVAARLLPVLARAVPVLPGADQFTIVDIDDTVRQTYGYAKQGAGRGYTAGVSAHQDAGQGTAPPGSSTDFKHCSPAPPRPRRRSRRGRRHPGVRRPTRRSRPSPH